MVQKAKQSRQVSVLATRNISVDMSGQLDAGELLSGTPTVVEVTTTNLTLSNKQVSSVQLVINNKAVAAGKAIQFRVEAAETGTYTIRVSCDTDASVPQTLYGDLTLKVV